jgi:hypothetical protein
MERDMLLGPYCTSTMRVPLINFFIPFMRKKTKNLYLLLVESIAQTLNVTSCHVCEGTNMGDHWLQEAKELESWVRINETDFFYLT